MMAFTFRAIEVWPGERTRTRQSSPFRASYSQTLDLLARELRHLGARNVVLEADCAPSEIRLDGQLRANARLNSPGVILSFESRYGPLQQRKAHTVQRRLERARRLMAGVDLVARGGRYSDAAEVAGLSDAFTFSRAFLQHLGARPSVLAREIRRSA